MNGQRTASFVGAIVASALLSASALASTGLTPRAERALGARYEAMADYYAKARREAISSRSGTGLSARAEKAWGARYVAMAEYYRKDVGTSSGAGVPPVSAGARGARCSLGGHRRVLPPSGARAGTAEGRSVRLARRRDRGARRDRDRGAARPRRPGAERVRAQAGAPRCPVGGSREGGATPPSRPGVRGVSRRTRSGRPAGRGPTPGRRTPR